MRSIRGLLRISTWYYGGEICNLSAFCPACDFEHGFRVDLVGHGKWDKHPFWTFNGDYDRPTFSPSMFSNRGRQFEPYFPSCHSFLTDGNWRYLNDCDHHLAGQIVPVPPPDPNMEFERQHGWHLFPWTDDQGRQLPKDGQGVYNPFLDTKLPTGLIRSRGMTAITTDWTEHRGGFVRAGADLPAPFRRAGGKPAITFHPTTRRLKIWIRPGAVPPCPLFINQVHLSDVTWISRGRGTDRHWQAMIDEGNVDLLLHPAPDVEEQQDTQDADLLRDIQAQVRTLDLPTMLQVFTSSPRLRNMPPWGQGTSYKALPPELWDRILDTMDRDDCEYARDTDGSDFPACFKAECAKSFGLGNAVGIVSDNSNVDMIRSYVGLLTVQPDATIQVSILESQDGIWGISPDEPTEGASGCIII